MPNPGSAEFVDWPTPRGVKDPFRRIPAYLKVGVTTAKHKTQPTGHRELMDWIIREISRFVTNPLKVKAMEDLVTGRVSCRSV